MPLLDSWVESTFSLCLSSTSWCFSCPLRFYKLNWNCLGNCLCGLPSTLLTLLPCCLVGLTLAETFSRPCSTSSTSAAVTSSDLLSYNILSAAFLGSVTWCCCDVAGQLIYIDFPACFLSCSKLLHPSVFNSLTDRTAALFNSSVYSTAMESKGTMITTHVAAGSLKGQISANINFFFFFPH